MAINIPPAGTPLIDQKGLINPAWYRYLVSLNTSTDQASSGEIATPSDSGLQGGGVVADGVTLSIAPGGVSDAMLRDSVATSVIGRFQNSGGPPADIQAAADNRVLSRESGALAFRSFMNGITIGPTTAAPFVRTDSLRLTTTAASSTTTVTHTVPIQVNGTTYHVLLSTSA